MIDSLKPFEFIDTELTTVQNSFDRDIAINEALPDSLDRGRSALDLYQEVVGNQFSELLVYTPMSEYVSLYFDACWSKC